MLLVWYRDRIDGVVSLMISRVNLTNLFFLHLLVLVLGVQVPSYVLIMSWIKSRRRRW